MSARVMQQPNGDDPTPSAAVRLVALAGAPVPEVWATLVDVGRWWPGTTLEARPGGRFEEHWTDERGRAVVTVGEVLRFEPLQLIELSWRDEGWPAPTTVTVVLREASGGTAVELTHVGWEALPDGPALAAAHRAGWGHHLAELCRASVRGG